MLAAVAGKLYRISGIFAPENNRWKMRGGRREESLAASSETQSRVGTSALSPKLPQPGELKIRIRRSSKNLGYFLWSGHFRSDSISQSVQPRILQQP